MNIIIVEDNEAIRKIIRLHLEIELDKNLDGIVKEFSSAEDVIKYLDAIKYLRDLGTIQTYWAIDGELEEKMTGIDLIKFLKDLNSDYIANAYFMGSYPEMQIEASNLGVSVYGKNKVAKTIADRIKENEK